MSIAGKGIAEKLPKLVGEEFLLRLRRRHLCQETDDIGGELGVTLGNENGAGGSPAMFNGFAGLNELGFTWFVRPAAFDDLGSGALRAGAHVTRFTARSCAVNAVGFAVTGFATNGAFGCVGSDALLAKVSSKLMPPSPNAQYQESGIPGCRRDRRNHPPSHS